MTDLVDRLLELHFKTYTLGLEQLQVGTITSNESEIFESIKSQLKQEHEIVETLRKKRNEKYKMICLNPNCMNYETLVNEIKCYDKLLEKIKEGKT